MCIAERITEICNQRGLTLKRVLATSRVSQNLIYRWKDGVVPRYTTVKRIADVLKIPVSELAPDLKADVNDDALGLPEEEVQANPSRAALSGYDKEPRRGFIVSASAFNKLKNILPSLDKDAIEVPHELVAASVAFGSPLTDCYQLVTEAVMPAAA